MLKLFILLIVMMFMVYFIVGWELMFVTLMGSTVVLLSVMYSEQMSFIIFGNDLGGNMMNMGLSLLSLWILGLMFMASVTMSDMKTGNYFNSLLIISLMLLLIVFLSMDLFMFYLSFEGVLIPTYILIIGWGYQPERLQAGLYLMFYTLIASLPLLMVILFMEGVYGGVVSSYIYLFNNKMFWSNLVIYIAGVLAFFVKMPLFMFHLWLPKAHVEAPIAGSMLLAGILLKMGGYGLFYLSNYFCLFIKKWSSFWLSLGLMGGVYLSLVCLRQNDIKSLIAYSSVVHMGLVIGGLMTLSWIGLVGSYVLMFGHGLCSSGLFCLANISYMKAQSRSLLLSKGMMSLMPSLSLLWFLMASSNMASPPSLNLLGEITLIGGLLGWGYQVLFILIFMSFLSAGYCLYLFSFTQHGEGVKLFGFYSVNLLDYMLIFMNWVPLNLLFLKT